MLNPHWPAPPPIGTSARARCGDCVWHFVGGRGAPVSRCRRHNSQPINPNDSVCPAYTTLLDCRECGACCREAFHTVDVSRRDPFARTHAHLLVEQDGRLQLPRPDGNCACLKSEGGRYACTAYADRPRSCRDFERGSDNCLTARRRVRLTP